MEIPCSGSALEIYTKLKSRFEDMQKKGKMAIIETIDYQDSSCSASAKGKGFKANIKCTDGKVDVSLDLGLLLKPLRGSIESKLKEKIQSFVA